MKFCSQCGTAAPTLKIPEGDNRPRYVCGTCNTIFYSNPKIVTGCLPLVGDQVLLCRRAIEPRYGYWNLPSGYMENGETVLEGALRELEEEAAAKGESFGLHMIYDLPKINQVYIHFLVEVAPGNFGVGEESLETALFSEADVPWDDMAFTSSVYSLRRFFADRQEGKRQVHMGVYPELG